MASRLEWLRARPNTSTRAPHAGDGARWARDDLHAAYAQARELLAADEASPPVEPHPYRGGSAVAGFFLMWLRTGSEPEVRRVSLAEGDHLVVGRHSGCDVHLPHDPELSLRHALLSCERLDDGTMGLRVIDLATSTGVALEDGVARRSMFFTGPAAVAMHRYALVAIPLDGTAPNDLPAAPPAPRVTSATSMPRRSLGPRSTTHVTLLPRVVELDDAARASATAPRARLTIGRGERAATVLLDDARLDAGVLVGRAPKCCAPLRRALTPGVSRAHLLVVRERDRIVAYDLCSVQGTYRDGQRVRRAVLEDGAELVLARGRHACALGYAAA